MNMVFFAKADLSSKRLFHMKSGVTMNICSLSLDRHRFIYFSMASKIRHMVSINFVTILRLLMDRGMK